MRIALVTTVALLFLAGPALADGPVATAGGAPTAAPTPATAPAALPIAGPTSPDGQPVAMGPCGPEKVKPDGKLDTAPHGEVEAGVGTSGYRHLAGAVCQPVGQDGFVAASASYSQANPTYRRH